jgi:predicted glycosyltransferase
MAALGVLRCVPAAELTPARLVDEIVAALAAPPRPVRLDLGGRARSAAILTRLLEEQRGAA